MQDQTISNNKIVVLLVFVCAALMSSVFIYHSTHQSKPAAIKPEKGLLFPAGRDIKMFSLKTTNNEDFMPINFKNHWTLVYFGFTHCSTVCPLTLDMLKRAYAKLKPNHPSLQLLFVSLDPKRDNMKRLGNYIHAYDKKFIGASGSEQELKKIQGMFGIYASKENASQDNDYQLIHTPSIMLISPQIKWVGMFKSNVTPSQFAATVTNSIVQLS